MNTHVVKRGFTLFRKSLDPEKHVYFNRHYTDHSESLYWPGRIIQPKSFAHKGPCADLTEKTTRALFSYLRNKYPDTFKFEASDYDRIKNNSFFCYDVNLPVEAENLALYLASNVVVKGSKFRPSVEQRARTEAIASEFLFRDIEFANATIREFVEKYAVALEKLADSSNNGRRHRFNLDASDVEKIYGVGGNNTLNLEKDHNNVLNRVLNYIH